VSCEVPFLYSCSFALHLRSLPQHILTHFSRFYANSCYYLDNLCVDFRYQRMGIGGKLLEWGIETAKGKGLGMQTEASPMGVGLYRKMGFQQVGVWGVKMVGTRSDEGEGEEEGDRVMYLPVMRRELGHGE
jgi:GNAT superfamily N-acetyltransferase